MHRDEADDDRHEVAGRERERRRDEPPVGVLGRHDQRRGHEHRERDHARREIEHDREPEVEPGLERGRDRQVHAREDHRERGEDHGRQRSLAVGVEREDDEGDHRRSRREHEPEPDQRGEDVLRALAAREPANRGAVEPELRQRGADQEEDGEDGEAAVVVDAEEARQDDRARGGERDRADVAPDLERRAAEHGGRMGALAGCDGGGRIGKWLDLGVHAPHGSIGIDDHGADGGDRSNRVCGGRALLERQGRHAAVSRLARGGRLRAARGDRRRQRLERRQPRGGRGRVPRGRRDPDGPERRLLRRRQRRDRGGDRARRGRGAAAQQRHGGRAGLPRAARRRARARRRGGVQPDPLRRVARSGLVRGSDVPAAARPSRPQHRVRRAAAARVGCRPTRSTAPAAGPCSCRARPSTRSASSTRSCSPTARISTGRSAPPARAGGWSSCRRASSGTGSRPRPVGSPRPTSLYYDVRNGLVVSERYAPLGRVGTALRRAESVLAHLAQGAMSHRRVEATRAVLAGWRDARRRRLGRRTL